MSEPLNEVPVMSRQSTECADLGEVSGIGNSSTTCMFSLLGQIPSQEM